MTRHPLSLAGAWLATVSAVLFVVVFVTDLFALHSSPYVGLVAFLIVPMLFVLGLLMIPAGIVLEHRRQRRGLEPRRLPRIDLNDPLHRRTIAIVLALTIANVVIPVRHGAGGRADLVVGQAVHAFTVAGRPARSAGLRRGALPVDAMCSGGFGVARGGLRSGPR